MKVTGIKYMAKETLFVIAAFVCMLGIIVISSIANAGLDLSKLNRTEVWSDTIINAAITIFGIIASVPSGIVSTKQRVNPDGSDGRYLQEFNAYHFIRQKIESKRQLFTQWHEHYYLNECYQKKKTYLVEKGVTQADAIMKLDRAQIQALTTPQVYKVDGKEFYFKSLTPIQLAACLKVYDGKVTVHKLSDFYFLYIDGKGSKSFYDKAYYETLDENFSFMCRILLKISLGFITTCIFTGLVIDYTNADMHNVAFVQKACLNIFTRIFNAVSSILWGYLIGQEHVYKQCYYINGKTQLLQSFDKDETFEYVDDQIAAKREYERSVVHNEQTAEQPGDFSDGPSAQAEAAV